MSKKTKEEVIQRIMNHPNYLKDKCTWNETIERINTAKGITPNSKFTIFYGQVWSMGGNYTRGVVEFKVSLWKTMKWFLKNDKCPMCYTQFKDSTDRVFEADGYYGIYQNNVS